MTNGNWSESRRPVLVELITVTAVWIAAIVIIDPRGNFPIVDDWDFATATWNFARSGHFHFTVFTAVSLRAMVLWGAAWSRLFGESFEVLRASTLALSLGTLLVVNRTLARGGVVPGLRVLATAALLFHPIFLWASCTYMTDVPFVFATACATYFFLRALQENRAGWLVAACVLVMTSWFIRQNGVVTLLAPLLLLLWQRERLAAKWRSFCAVIASFLILFAGLLAFKTEWLAGSPAMFAVHFHMWTESTFRLPEQAATLFHYVVFNAQNAALFLLPLSLPIVLLLRRLRRRDIIILLLLSAALIARAVDLARSGHLMPYSDAHLFSDILPGNLFFDFGIGTPMLFDTFTLQLPFPFTLTTAGRIGLTMLATMLASVTLWSLLRGGKQPLLGQLAALMAGIGTLALFGSGYYYDRYALDSAWTLCLVLPLLLPWQQRMTRILAIGGLLLIASFSILGVQEHFRWQRARWAAWNELRAQGVAVSAIEGGAEASGLYELANASLAEARRGHPPRRFALTFRSLPGYRTLAAHPFTSFLGMRQGTVYTLERISGTSASDGRG